MDPRKDQIKVGSMVVVATLLFLCALLFVGGLNLFRKKRVTYTAHFRFAGGLEPGTYVRFGGLRVGTVKGIELDPRDSTRILVEFEVRATIPIRANSKARISSLGLLGENYLEVSPGTREARQLPPGSEVPTSEMVEMADVINNVNVVAVGANKLLSDLDPQVLALTGNLNRLIDNLRAVAGPENRQHLQATLANVDAMLAEDRPPLKRTLGNLEGATAKLGPAIDNANTLVNHFDKIAVENREALHGALLNLRDALKDARRVMGDLNETLVGNRDNLDEILENLRMTSQNLKQFTNTIKQRPFSLIRVKAEKDRVPPVAR